MSEDWNFYLCNVNNVLASIALDLGLRKFVPDKGRPILLWVWVYLKRPREDGLSASSEFESLTEVENKLTKTMIERFGAVLCGRITTDGLQRYIAAKKITPPKLRALGSVRVRLWTERDINRVRKELPGIKNGRSKGRARRIK